MLMPIKPRAPSRLSPAASTSRDQTVTRLLVLRSHRPIRAHDPIDPQADRRELVQRIDDDGSRCYEHANVEIHGILSLSSASNP